jgi:hypothetical protein
MQRILLWFAIVVVLFGIAYLLRSYGGLWW